MYYCTALSTIFDWICALQLFIIVIIVIIIIIISSPFALMEHQASRYPVITGKERETLLKEMAADSQQVQRSTVRDVVYIPRHFINPNDCDCHVHRHVTVGGANLSQCAKVAVFSLQKK